MTNETTGAILTTRAETNVASLRQGRRKADRSLTGLRDMPRVAAVDPAC